MQTETASKKVINGWAMYDWANSVYNLVITSTIFPTYYESITGDGNELTSNDSVVLFGRTFANTALYNYALAIAFTVVALILPLLTSIADFKGNKKKFLFFFCTLGSLACASLFFFKTSADLPIGLLLMIIACISFWSSYVFSNSYLPEIAAPKDMDRISAKGFSMGYIGSVILQCICFVFIFSPSTFSMDADKTLPARFCFLLVGIWWWGFAQYSLSCLPKGIPAAPDNDRNVLTNGYKELKKVWQELSKLPVLKKFLTAFFFYNMGVQTIMLAASLYGKSELAIPTENLILAILLIQLVAIPGAIFIAKLSAKIGNIKALMVIVLCWVLLCVYGYFTPKGNVYSFYVLGAMVGFVMGGIQSLSRSTYAKLMPETKDTASFFSFYDVTEKIAIVIGMLSFGTIIEVTGSQRNSVLALAIFFLIGFFLLTITLKEQNKKIAL
jgi:MFS transporter, UMF1 family